MKQVNVTDDSSTLKVQIPDEIVSVGDWKALGSVFLELVHIAKLPAGSYELHIRRTFSRSSNDRVFRFEHGARDIIYLYGVFVGGLNGFSAYVFGVLKVDQRSPLGGLLDRLNTAAGLVQPSMAAQGQPLAEVLSGDTPPDVPDDVEPERARPDGDAGVEASPDQSLGAEAAQPVAAPEVAAGTKTVLPEAEASGEPVTVPQSATQQPVGQHEGRREMKKGSRRVAPNKQRPLLSGARLAKMMQAIEDLRRTAEEIAAIRRMFGKRV